MLSDLQSLVYLLLIFGNNETRLGMVNDILDFLCYRVLIGRHGNTAKCLRRNHGAIKGRSVITDDDKGVVADKAKVGEPGGQGKGVLAELPQRPGLPDAVGLFTHCRPLGIVLQSLP